MTPAGQHRAAVVRLPPDPDLTLLGEPRMIKLQALLVSGRRSLADSGLCTCGRLWDAGPDKMADV